jgi:hypothetical protein
MSPSTPALRRLITLILLLVLLDVLAIPIHHHPLPSFIPPAPPISPDNGWVLDEQAWPDIVAGQITTATRRPGVGKTAPPASPLPNVSSPLLLSTDNGWVPEKRVWLDISLGTPEGSIITSSTVNGPVAAAVLSTGSMHGCIWSEGAWANDAFPSAMRRLLLGSAGEDVVVSSVGGSSSAKTVTYLHRFARHFEHHMRRRAIAVNPSQGYSGSVWAALHLEALLRKESRIVFWEFAINDW